jgi:uncharacterized membrane protein YqaE (UPF0057 family)
MKQLILSFVCLLFVATMANAEIAAVNTPLSECNSASDIKAIDPQLVKLGMDKFLEITPAEYKKITGQRLGLKNSLALKAAQVKVKHEMKNATISPVGTAGDGITKGVYILMAFFGLAWLAMGLKSDWSGSDWIVNLILTALCWLPGFIHALVKMKDYYQ